MVTALFPAAGQGKRMNVGMNKVFMKLAGEPILLHSLRKFSKCAEISDLLVLVAPEEIPAAEKLLSTASGLKPWRIVAGGAERQYSIANGLKQLAADCEFVLVHDAARPLVSSRTIQMVIAAAREYGAAIAAVPEKNTIKVVDEDNFVTATPERKQLWSVQTPQGFRREVLERAYAEAENSGFLGTDDASLAERLGVKVKVVLSDYENFKITTPDDLLAAEAVLAR